MSKKKDKFQLIAMTSVGTMLVLQILGNTAALSRHKHDESGKMTLEGSTSMTTSSSSSHPKNIFVGGRMIGMSTSTTTSSSASHPQGMYRTY